MTSLSSFLCKYCGKSFQSNGSLRKHVKKFHCGMELPQCLRTGHKVEEHDVQQVLETCDSCGKTFHHKSSLCRHKSLMHKVSEKNEQMCMVEKLEFVNIEGNLDVHINFAVHIQCSIPVYTVIYFDLV